MTPSTSPCDRDRIRLFVEQELSGAELQKLEEHLSACSACRAALDDLVADAQAWSDARGCLAEPGETETYPQAEKRGLLECYRSLLGPTDDPRMLGRVGSYEIVGLLGAGGMGVVFKAFDPPLNRYVALKVLSPLYHTNAVAIQRFMREAQSAAAVLHENVIAIHSIDRWRDAPYLVMTYVRGESLHRRLTRRGALSVREVLRIGMQIAAGLAAAHAQGLIHRDVKPANILLETDVDRVKISDFGLARAIDDVRLTKSNALIGTPQYMSPEQARDDLLDYRTDLFSLGSVLYEACTGRAPFYASTTYGILRRIVEEQPPPVRQLNPEIPDWLERIVVKLMAKDRTARFASATEVETLLRQCLAHVEQPHLVALPDAVAPTPERSVVRSIRRWRIAMTVVTIGLVIGLGTAYIGQTGQLKNDPRSPKLERKGTLAPTPNKDAKGGGVPNAGEYKIDVLGVADVRGMKMTTEFDLSRMKMQQQGQAFGKPGAGGFAGGGGGASGGSLLKPNLGIALRIEPLVPKADTFVKLGSNVTAIDDLGQTIEAKNLGPVINHFAQFENRWPDAQFLYVAQGAGAATRIVRLQGELLVTPGRKLTARFDGVKSQTQKVGKDVFKLEGVASSGEGIQVTVTFLQLRSMERARTPQERFQAMITNRGSYTAVIEDNMGELHPAQGASSVGGGATSSFSANKNGGRGFAKSGDSASQTFTFGPLPEGRTVETIRVSMEERLGEAKTVAFTLENILLP